MKKILRLSQIAFVVAIPAMLGTGCLGPKVLSENVSHVAAVDPRVELRLKTNAPTDVLVIYDDVNLETAKVTRQAYYLLANQEQISHGRRPEFVKLSTGDHLSPLPLLKERPENPDKVTNELYGVELTTRQYRLASREHVVTEFSLPEYHRWLTAKKVFLFPGAVAVDAVGLGAVIAVSDPPLAATAVDAAIRAAK